MKSSCPGILAHCLNSGERLYDIKPDKKMTEFDINKLEGLHTASEVLDKKYGRKGTESREEFDGKARAWYYGEILRDRRKELRMTQQELADKVGTARSYIARVEKGETDMQMSSFLRIASAMGLSVELKAI